mgnify:CR=1 FL=1
MPMEGSALHGCRKSCSEARRAHWCQAEEKRTARSLARTPSKQARSRKLIHLSRSCSVFSFPRRDLRRQVCVIVFMVGGWQPYREEASTFKFPGADRIVSPPLLPADLRLSFNPRPPTSPERGRWHNSSQDHVLAPDPSQPPAARSTRTKNLRPSPTTTSATRSGQTTTPSSAPSQERLVENSSRRGMRT